MTTRLLSFITAAAFGVSVLGAGLATAQAAPAEPVQVEADRLDLDQRAGTAVYRGNVEVRQGEMHLRGARVEIQRNDSGELSRATAFGERAYLRHRPDGQKEPIEGEARQIIYHVAERRVELIDQAELDQGEIISAAAGLNTLLTRKWCRHALMWKAATTSVSA